MTALRVVVRVGILWVISLVVAVAGMEVGHRIVIATDRDEIPTATQQTTSAVSIDNEPAQHQWR